MKGLDDRLIGSADKKEEPRYRDDDAPDTEEAEKPSEIIKKILILSRFPSQSECKIFYDLCYEKGNGNNKGNELNEHINSEGSR